MGRLRVPDEVQGKEGHSKRGNGGTGYRNPVCSRLATSVGNKGTKFTMQLKIILNSRSCCSYFPTLTPRTGTRATMSSVASRT